MISRVTSLAGRESASIDITTTLRRGTAAVESVAAASSSFSLTFGSAISVRRTRHLLVDLEWEMGPLRRPRKKRVDQGQSRPPPAPPRRWQGSFHTLMLRCHRGEE